MSCSILFYAATDAEPFAGLEITLDVSYDLADGAIQRSHVASP